MTWILAGTVGYLAGATLAWAFIAAATRKPSPEPFRPLQDLGQLARVA